MESKHHLENKATKLINPILSFPCRGVGRPEIWKLLIQKPEYRECCDWEYRQWRACFFLQFYKQIMKPVTKINTFKILPSMLLPKSAISLSKEAANTKQESRKKERSQANLFFPYSYMLCWLLFPPRMWPYESFMNTVCVYLGWYLICMLMLFLWFLHWWCLPCILHNIYSNTKWARVLSGTQDCALLCMLSQEIAAYSGLLRNHKLLFPISLRVMPLEGTEDEPWC